METIWENIEKLITFYNHYWPILFAGTDRADKALLLVFVHPQSSTDGYTHQQNVIKLGFTPSDIEKVFETWDYNSRDFNRGLPHWVSVLIHEMFHEFQLKISPQQTARGIELYNWLQISPSLININPPEHLHGFNGEGHDEIFYTTLSNKAEIFNLRETAFVTENPYSPSALMRKLRVFAYGSNMNRKRLRTRCPSANKIENAVLKKYGFKCNKRSIDGSSKGNIVRTGRGSDQVWGVIFEILRSEKPSLDQAEGLGNGYIEEYMEFVTETGTSEALVYIADNNSVDDNLLPYDWYKEFIVTGALQNNLPIEYLEMLEALTVQIDPDEDRQRRNRLIL